jgi:hypothetical protein
MFEGRYKSALDEKQRTRLIQQENYDLANDLGTAGVLKNVGGSKEQLEHQRKNPNLANLQDQAQFEQHKAQVATALAFVKQHNFNPKNPNWIFPKNDVLKYLAKNDPEFDNYAGERKKNGECTEADIDKMKAMTPVEAQNMLKFKSAIEAWNKIQAPTIPDTEIIPLITEQGQSYPSQVGKIRGDTKKIDQFVFRPILEYVANNPQIFRK